MMSGQGSRLVARVPAPPERPSGRPTATYRSSTRNCFKCNQSVILDFGQSDECATSDRAPLFHRFGTDAGCDHGRPRFVDWGHDRFCGMRCRHSDENLR